jgi:predicted metal-dependent phosphoesterase TrpH
LKTLAFDKPGKFYKGNLHTHSTASDGRCSPEEVCRRYKEAGYDFLSLTDHFLETYNYPLTDTRAFQTEGFTTLIGAELHTGLIEVGELWHILAVGLPLTFKPGPKDETGPELAQRALAAGAFVAAAHPSWYSLSENDILSLGNIHAIEIYNAVSADYNDRPESWHIADTLLAKGHRYSTCATDDYHAVPDRYDLGRGWVQVKSESGNPDDLLAALKAGHYYSSTGPEIHTIEISGDKLYVRCSAAERIFVTGKGAKATHAAGYGLVEAEFNIAKFQDSYCRVTVRDTHEGRAWSNPIWFD